MLTIDGDVVSNSFTVGRTPEGLVTLNGSIVLGGRAVGPDHDERVRVVAAVDVDVVALTPATR